MHRASQHASKHALCTAFLNHQSRIRFNFQRPRILYLFSSIKLPALRCSMWHVCKCSWYLGWRCSCHAVYRLYTLCCVLVGFESRHNWLFSRINIISGFFFLPLLLFHFFPGSSAPSYFPFDSFSTQPGSPPNSTIQSPPSRNLQIK